MLGGEEFISTIATELDLTEHTGTARLGQADEGARPPARLRRHRDHRPHRPRPSLGRGAGRVRRPGRRQRRRRRSSGRYPNPGPLVLVRGGVWLVDVPASSSSTRSRTASGSPSGAASLFRNGTCVATGRTLDGARARGCARGTGEPGDRGARGVRRQHDALSTGGGSAARRGDRLPAADDELPRPPCARRRARAGLQARPADRAVRTSATSSPCSSPSTAARTRCSRRGWKPDVIVGDLDSVSDATLRCGAEILVHAYAHGHAPGAERLRRLGAPVPDRRRAGNLRGHRASARARAGRRADRRRRHPLQPRRVHGAQPRRHGVDVRDAAQGGRVLVDAKGVSRLVAPRIGVWPLVLFALAALAALVVAVWRRRR